MLGIVLLKCFLVPCFLLMFCSECISLDEPQMAMRRIFSTWMTNDKPPFQKVMPAARTWKGQDMSVKWASDPLQQVTDSRYPGDEPGFVLTPEEKIKFKIWPHGVIPYYMDDLSFDKVLRDRIRNYLSLVNVATGLHFMELPAPPIDKSTRWVFFLNRRSLLGCSDHTTDSFTNEGVQKVVLGYDCLSSSGELAKVVLALAGVPPQHNSPNRDEHIQVDMDNVLPDKKHLFKKLDDKDWLFHDIPYDFQSAGHYHLHEYSATGSATIVPKKYLEYPVGETNELSYNDIWKIRMLYNYDQRYTKDVTNFHAPECYKMFEPGANFSQYRPISDDELPPRPKPAKYLGVSEVIPRAPISTEEENKSKEMINNDQRINISSDNISAGRDTDTINPNKQENGKQTLKQKRNPILILSDYNTDQRHITRDKKTPALGKFTKVDGRRSHGYRGEK